MPPASAVHGICNPDTGLGLSLMLGTDYERRKNKLKQELQLDYQNFVAKKHHPRSNEGRHQPQHASLPIDEKRSVQKHHPRSNEGRHQPQYASLPIDEKRSVQDKLREERNKEYNLFLQGQAKSQRLRRGTQRVTPKPGKDQASDGVRKFPPPASPPPIINAHPNVNHAPRDHYSSRPDAATLVADELVDDGQRKETGGPGHGGRRRWQQHPRPEVTYCFEEDLIKDEEDECEFRDRRKRQQDRHTQGPKYKENRRTAKKRRPKRATPDMAEVEAPGVHDQDNNEGLWQSDLQMPDSMRPAARSRSVPSRDKAEFATGLMIGSMEEQAASQMRKERYKHELLRQMEEQHRNKIREKQLGLRVAVTGAIDPQRKPGLYGAHAGPVSHGYDGRMPDVHYVPAMDVDAVRNGQNLPPKLDQSAEDTENTLPPGQRHFVDPNAPLGHPLGRRAAPGVPPLVPPLDYYNDYHRNFANVPRMAGVPPPVYPPMTTDYRTPYDDAYYYYGTRNPLHHHGLLDGVLHSGNFYSPPQRPPPLRHFGYPDPSDMYGDPSIGVDMSRQQKERALSYQEALRKQIKEREERKKREKEERERYDAKIEAEMRAYNPWGKSGGGAPIKDQCGNLVSDLNQMHRINRESYRNPMSGRLAQSPLIVDGDTPRTEAGTPLSHRLGFSDEQQQVHVKDRYKEELTRQIQENRQKQEEERELMRIKEEKEEKRMQEQRARIQREYEEEQRKHNGSEHRTKYKVQTQEPIPQQREEEKRELEKKREKEKKRTVPRSAKEREEERRRQLNYEREPSPPIPTLQRKNTNLKASRPSSAESQPSPRTLRSASAPECRPVPEKTPELQDGQKEVMRELSTLRRYLKKEQRQLEAQLGRAERQKSPLSAPNSYCSQVSQQSRGYPHRPRGRPRVEAFEPVHKQPDQPSSQVNMQNIREFNQLKYRDTESREEVRHMYPDPPTDSLSLDIQQQALLREQQRQIRLMQKEEERDYLFQHPSRYRSRSKAARHIVRDDKLPSDTSFFDLYSGDAASEEGDSVQRRRRPSADHRDRTATQKRRDYDERDSNTPSDAHSLPSLDSLNFEGRAHNRPRVTRQDNCNGDHIGGSEGRSGDESDALSMDRCVSVETVATEPWLRPGTSEAVKGPGSRETNSRTNAPPWLTQRLK